MTPPYAAVPPYKIVVAGAGTVGEASINMLQSGRVTEALAGYGIEIVKVLVNDANKKRPNLQVDPSKLTSDKNELIQSGANMLIEVMGGITDAKDLVNKALHLGMDVVTANKALIADDLPGLRSKLNEGSSKFGMEAAVGGGIPIISTLSRSYSADEISEVTGILNGTTNFILTKMQKEGMSYEDAFKLADELGYAEADVPGEPNPDLDGPDSRSKLAILANQAFGVDLDEETFFMQGIREISAVDFKYAADLGANIKFVGVAKKDGETVSYYISPSIVSNDLDIAQTNGVNNVISVNSKNMGLRSFDGAGAGPEATANSVVADVIHIVKGGNTQLRDSNSDITLEPNFTAPFYIRCTIDDSAGIVGKMTTLMGEKGINIDKVLQTEEDGDGNSVFVCTTDEVDIDTVKGLQALLNDQDYMKEGVLILPILN